MFYCPRCGYSTSIKCNYKKHLSSVNCQDINHSNMDSSSLLSSVSPNPVFKNSNKYVCKYCQKSFAFQQSKHKHEKKCKSLGTTLIISL